MTDDLTTSPRVPHGPGTAAAFPRGAWIGANAAGIAMAFGLFALVGGVIEAMGADHDSVARNLPALVAMAAGGLAFALLRRRALRETGVGSRRQLLLIAVCPPVGLLLGLGIAPFDWICAMLLAGTVGGAIQLRRYRPVSLRSVLVGAASWLGAGLIFTATAVVLIDVVMVRLLGLDGDSAAGFGIILTVLGLAGGGAGGAIEGRTVARLRGS
jgi:hypothetical protein